LALALVAQMCSLFEMASENPGYVTAACRIGKHGDCPRHVVPNCACECHLPSVLAQPGILDGLELLDAFLDLLVREAREPEQ
jgi:hypothetical protein